jgi:hypothetical protein
MAIKFLYYLQWNYIFQNLIKSCFAAFDTDTASGYAVNYHLRELKLKIKKIILISIKRLSKDDFFFIFLFL